jgi:hypothetical protein
MGEQVASPGEHLHRLRGSDRMPAPLVFEMTGQHIALLRRACVGWEDCESGAPAIDCKRPYGNSSVWQDVAEILGVAKLETDDDEHVYPKGTRDHCERLHRETETALQIILATGSFEPGTYRRNEYQRDWKKVLR